MYGGRPKSVGNCPTMLRLRHVPNKEGEERRKKGSYSGGGPTASNSGWTPVKLPPGLSAVHELACRQSFIAISTKKEKVIYFPPRNPANSGGPPCT